MSIVTLLRRPFATLRADLGRARAQRAKQRELDRAFRAFRRGR